MSTVFARACLITALSVFGTEAFISAQQLAAPAQAAQAAARELVTMRITAEEAVRLAAENNLGIQIERYNPQIQEVSVSQARAAWVPSLVSSFEGTGNRQMRVAEPTGAPATEPTEGPTETPEADRAEGKE